jgi:hypothetical protein
VIFEWTCGSSTPAFAKPTEISRSLSQGPANQPFVSLVLRSCLIPARYAMTAGKVESFCPSDHAFGEELARRG